MKIKNARASLFQSSEDGKQEIYFMRPYHIYIYIRRKGGNTFLSVFYSREKRNEIIIFVSETFVMNL